jgi:hypothetical protein
MNSQYIRRRSKLARRLSWLVVAGLATAALIGPSASSVAAATPTDGTTSNLQGIAGSYTNVLIDGAGGTNQDTILFCDDDTATQFTSHISFHLSETAPAGSFFTVYLTPNGGAQLSPAGVDITENQGTIDTSGLTAGDHTLAITLNVTTSFSITSGGVLLVIADDVSGAEFHSKSNSLNCTESTPTPTPTEEPTPTPTATPTEEPTPTPTATPTEEPTPTPTGSAGGETFTPTPSGGVGGETFTPTNTPPPTDALASTGSTPGGDSWRLVFLAMAGLLAAVLLLTPAEALTRRGKKDR